MAETQRSEWSANGPLLLSAVIGIPVPVAMSYLLGQFMVPLEQEFGWSRSQASIGFSISLLLGFVSSLPQWPSLAGVFGIDQAVVFGIVRDGSRHHPLTRLKGQWVWLQDVRKVDVQVGQAQRAWFGHGGLRVSAAVAAVAAVTVGGDRGAQGGGGQR